MVSAEQVVFGVMSAGLLAVVAATIYLHTLPDAVCVQKRVITSIGACNKNGHCGVMLDGEVVDIVSYPVVGATVCTEWSR